MTRQQAIELLRFTKVYVKDKSKQIQQKAFELGFRWLYSRDNDGLAFEHLDAPFILFTGKTMHPCCDVERFNYDDSKEITAEEILAITTDDEPRFRPFKNPDECLNEMLKHQPFGWVNDKESPYKYCITGLRDLDGFNYSIWDMALKCLTFADGAPFGILE
ncbi:MAG: hypothetical protein ACI4AM_06460 [Muribaculaceae bacterium]